MAQAGNHKFEQKKMKFCNTVWIKKTRSVRYFLNLWVKTGENSLLNIMQALRDMLNGVINGDPFKKKVGGCCS